MAALLLIENEGLFSPSVSCIIVFIQMELLLWSNWKANADDANASLAIWQPHLAKHSNPVYLTMPMVWIPWPFVIFIMTESNSKERHHETLPKQLLNRHNGTYHFVSASLFCGVGITIEVIKLKFNDR